MNEKLPPPPGGYHETEAIGAGGGDTPGASEEWPPFPRHLLSGIPSDWPPDELAPVGPAPVVAPVVAPQGVIKEFAEHVNLATKHPNVVANFFAGVAFVAGMAGGRYVGHMGKTRTDIREYIMMIAGPSSGKDAGRKLINAIYNHNEIRAPGLIRSAASGEGIEDELIEAKGTALFLSNEAQGLIRAMADERPGPLSRALELLLEVYTSAGTSFKRRAMSKGNKNKKKGEDGPPAPEPYINNPCLTWYGDSTPDAFYPVCNERLFRNGLLARMIIIEGDKRRRNHEPQKDLYDIPNFLLRFAKHCLTQPREEPIPIKYHPDAAMRLSAVETFVDDQYRDAADEAGQALWGRAAEHAATLAHIAAISNNYSAPCVTADCVEWAIAVVSWAVTRLLARRDARETAMTLQRKQALGDIDRIRKAMAEKGKEYKRSQLLKAAKIPAADFERAMMTLMECGEVALAKRGNGGNVPTLYRRL